MGRFSSGKTTLLNNILGRTPDGYPLLRTAWTHNTALLAKFHYCEAGQRRVELTYHPKLNREPLMELGTASERATFAPCGGQVASISVAPDQGIMIIVTRTSDGASRSVRIEPPQRLRQGIKPGSMVREGEELSTGASIQELRNQASRRGEVWATIRGPAIAQVLHLRAERKLVNLRFDVTLAVPGVMGTSIVERVFTGDDGDWMQWLATLTDKEHSHRLSEISGAFSPIEIYLSADVDQSRCAKSHELMTDDDWNWFQGSPTAPSTKTPRESRTAHIGFAESADAELLVDEADIYLNGPLFQLLNIVDTPGLNSITPRHSIKTEEFIQKGTAYLVVLQMNTAGKDQATEALFEMIGASLRSVHNASTPGRTTKPSDHVFILLNRFKNFSSNAVWGEQMDDFLKLVKASFHPCPKIYLADLKEQSSRETVSGEMFGYPSLAVLFRDLRRYVANQGVSHKIDAAYADLESAWEYASLEVEREGQDIEGKSPAKTLAEIAKARLDLARAVSRSSEAAESRINKVLGAAHDARQLLSLMDDRDGFIAAKDNAGRMGSFNRERDRLKEVTPLSAARTGRGR